jgi:ATP diphosphatase
MQKVNEELDEVRQEMSKVDQNCLQDELGDLLFSIVNLVRLLGMDAEQTLSRANEKFERRFRAMERALYEEGNSDIQGLSLKLMDDAWERVKRNESGNDY